MGGMEVRIGGKSRRLARFESPRRDLLPRPRLARVGLVVRALSLSLLGSLGRSPRRSRSCRPAPGAKKKRVRARKQALKMENLLRGASSG